MVETTYNTYWNNLPTVMPFSGNKCCKRLYFCIDPAYIGKDVMPTTVGGRLRLKHRIQIFDKDWAYDQTRVYPVNPLYKRPKIKQSRFGKDAMYSTVTMANPFVKGNPKITFLNSYQKIFYPLFSTMFVSLAPLTDEEEPAEKKIKL